MTPTRAKAIVVFVSLLLSVLPLWSAADPNVYLALTSYAGRGKHPASGQTALIIDKNTTGSHFICFGYTILTEKKIKGKVSVQAELLTAAGTRVLQTVDNVAVESFEIGGQEPFENPCTGEQVPTSPFEFNYGSVSECVSFQADLKSGDIVRWVFDFEKMSRLKGVVATFQVLGQILPDVFGLTAEEAKSAFREEWARSTFLQPSLEIRRD